MFLIVLETFMFEIAVMAILICFWLKFKLRKIPVKIKVFEGGVIPEYKTDGAADADCFCRLDSESITIPPFGRTLVNLGFALEVPEGFKTVIDPRSSFLKKEGGFVCHGEIDNDYRGELKANIVNMNHNKDLVIENNQRICQIHIIPVWNMSFTPVNKLSDTKRGDGGWGSTGR